MRAHVLVDRVAGRLPRGRRDGNGEHDPSGALRLAATGTPRRRRTGRDPVVDDDDRASGDRARRVSEQLRSCGSSSARSRSSTTRERLGRHAARRTASSFTTSHALGDRSDRVLLVRRRSELADDRDGERQARGRERPRRRRRRHRGGCRARPRPRRDARPARRRAVVPRPPDRRRWPRRHDTPAASVLTGNARRTIGCSMHVNRKGACDERDRP